MLINFTTYDESELQQLSSHTSYKTCLLSKPSFIIFTIYSITHIFLHFPLSIIILKHGVQQWQKNRSASPAATSHSDAFTYNMVVMELIGVFGYFFTCCGIYKIDYGLMQAGIMLSTFTWFGETFFNVLTCLERYLAVVHPIIYVSLRNKTGITIRNISIVFVWLISSVGIISVSASFYILLNFVVLIMSLTVVSYHSLSVLCALIRPGPGEQGRERADQSKRRAFYTIMVILGVLVLRLLWGFIWTVWYLSDTEIDCVTMTLDVWFNLASTLVLPLLFLHRTGKLGRWMNVK